LEVPVTGREENERERMGERIDLIMEARDWEDDAPPPGLESSVEKKTRGLG
jgi:hypothetical protein